MPKKLEVKNIFSKIDEISSYWAGFIAADGNMSSDFYKLNLGVAQKDIKHLVQFQKDINSNHKKTTRKSDGFVSVSIRDRDICEALYRQFNITPNKSLTFTPPTLSMDNMRHFIRGMIDGDGSVSRYSKYNYLHITFTSGSLACAAILRDVIYNCCAIYSKIGHQGKCSIIQYSGSSADKLAKYLYNNATRFLDRKREKCATIYLQVY